MQTDNQLIGDKAEKHRNPLRRFRRHRQDKFDSTDLFERASVPRAVASLALPAVASQLVVLAYNMADTWFIGQTGDPAQVAALTATFPIYMLLNAVSNLFGVGGGSLVSRSLGAHDEQRARRVATTSAWLAVVFSLVTGAILLLAAEPLLRLLGTPEAVMPHARAFLWFAASAGAVPTVTGLVLASMLQAQGKPGVASAGMCMGVLLCIALDPLFIFELDLGVAGAALATAIANTASALFFIGYFIRNRKRLQVPISARPSRPDGADLREIFAVGFPAAVIIALGSLSNGVLVALLSSAPVTAESGLGVVQKLELVPFQLIMGVTGGVVPLVAYCSKSGNRTRMRATMRFVLAIALAAAAIVLVIYEALAEPLVSLFVSDAESVAFGAAFLRLRILALPAIVVEFALNSAFQATGSSKQSLTVSVMRKGTIDLPLMIALNAIWPIYGLMLVQPIMESVTALTAIALWVRLDNRNTDKRKEGIAQRQSRPAAAKAVTQ